MHIAPIRSFLAKALIVLEKGRNVLGFGTYCRLDGNEVGEDTIGSLINSIVINMLKFSERFDNVQIVLTPSNNVL